MPNLAASFHSLTPPLRAERSTLWIHLGVLPAAPGNNLPVVAAMWPCSVMKSQLSAFGSRKTSMLWTLVVFMNSFSPALRAGRSNPVNHFGPRLALSGSVNPAKFGPTAMLPVCAMYSPSPELLSRNASTPQRLVSLVISFSSNLRQARSNSWDHCSSFSFFSCPRVTPRPHSNAKTKYAVLRRPTWKVFDIVEPHRSREIRQDDFMKTIDSRQANAHASEMPVD